MSVQGTGRATRVLVDFEATPGTSPTAGSRKPILMPFNTCDLTGERPINQAATLNNDRSATIPYRGFKNVSGTIVAPVDPNNFGVWLKAAYGTPVTGERPSTANDIMDGTPTLTLSSGAYTFSSAQVATIVGDIVLFLNASGVLTECYVATKTNDTTGTVTDNPDVATFPADIAAVTILGIIDNLSPASAGTIAISSGTATLSVAQTGIAVGDMLKYNDGSDETLIVWVTAVASTTSVSVVAADEFAPSDTGAVTLFGFFRPSLWNHLFDIDATAAIPSISIEKGFTDITTPEYFVYTGVKVGGIDVTIGGDGELTASISLLGIDEAGDTTAYDNNAADTAVAIYSTRFQNTNSTATEGGSLSVLMQSIQHTFNNDLDADQYVMNATGIRDGIPEGIASVSGNIKALLKDVVIIEKGTGDTASSLSVTVTEGQETVTFTVGELKYQDKTPAIPGPKGLLVDMDYVGYKDTGTTATSVTLLTFKGGF